MRRYELRFGLLGPPVLYDTGTETDAGTGTGTETDAGTGTGTGTDTFRRSYGDDGTPYGVALPGVRTVRSPKARALLAALLLDAGRIVPVESLKEALWGGAPPASAHASLHNHVSRLRRLLDDPERLRAAPPGYRLRVEPGELDVYVFERRLAAARGAHAARNWERVVGECTAALALWRGAPLSGLPAELGGYALVQRLKEARLLLLEWRYDAELALGEAGSEQLIPELTELAARHPLREAYHRQLMLALHRAGRRAEALAVHRDLRTHLVEELGVEPGPTVREAHVEVLRDPDPATGEGDDSAGRAGGDSGGDAEADSPRIGVECVECVGGVGGVQRVEYGTPPADGTSQARDTPPPSASPRPAQLPPPPAHFTGRAALIRRMRAALAVEPSAGPLVVSGMAGVGKSALALQVGHQLKERFADGQLYLNLHGATPGMAPLTAAQALTALLRDLGVDPRRIPELPDAAAALLRTLLAPTRTLLVLDDAAHAAQVRPLLPAGPGCAVIVTSRSPLTALDGAHRFPLTPLTAEESAELLRAASGRSPHTGPAAEPDPRGQGLTASHPLVELTGRLPLALRVVAARLAARGVLTPDTLARQLADTGSRLHHLEYDDLSVRRSLAVAHDALAASGREADRDAALALRRIGALDLPTYGAPLLARLTGTDERRAEAALDRLVDVALLEETSYGRYAPHDLVRDFARELAEAEGAADMTAHALRWYAAVAERALAVIVEPGLDHDDRRRPTAAQPPSHSAHVNEVPPFAAPEAAFAWGDAELENVLALATCRGSDTGGVGTGNDDSHGSEKAGCRAGRNAGDGHAAAAEAVAAGEHAAAEAVAAGEHAAADRTVAVSEHPAAAHEHPAGDEPAAAHEHAAGDEPAAAYEHAAGDEPAAAYEHAAGDEPAAAYEHAAGDEPAAAYEHPIGDEPTAAHETPGDQPPGDEAAALVSTLLRLLFPYLHRSGRVAEMEVLGRTALRLARRLGDDAAEAYALSDLAGLHFLTGRQQRALALTDRALTIWRRLDRPSWIRRCLNNRGLLLESLGRHEESGAALRQSLEYSRRLDDPHGEAVTHSHLGNLYEHTDPRAAIEQHRRSLAIGVEIGAVIVQHSAHCNIGYAHLTLGEPAAALPHFEESRRILGGHGDWHGESQTRLGLVRTLRLLGRTAHALEECAELLRRADDRADPYTGGLARHQHGLLLRESGRTAQAYEEWRGALAALDGTDEREIVGELRDLLTETTD
ncbi:BTAD domain-containing putative transcriptional regulator [Streptomyces sp. NPDC002328]|uniref:AfsR/SARP family transcriptional regulator n=1 Tax=Streptomyces sp. NPDC002328 TaxID=3364642 RepID=UPI0036A7A0ED